MQDESWEEGDSDYDIQSLDGDGNESLDEHGNESDSQNEDRNESLDEDRNESSLDENWSTDEDEVDKTAPCNDESSGSGTVEGCVASSLQTWDEAEYTDTSDEEVSIY